MDYMELSDNLNEQLSKARGERDIAIKHMVDLEYQVCRLREELQKNEASLSEIFSRTYGPFKQKISQWLQAERDGRLVVLPCGTDVELVRDGYAFKADHWNHTLTAFRDEPKNKSGKQVALFSTKEAEAALKGASE